MDNLKALVLSATFQVLRQCFSYSLKLSAFLISCFACCFLIAGEIPAVMSFLASARIYRHFREAVAGDGQKEKLALQAAPVLGSAMFTDC